MLAAVYRSVLPLALKHGVTTEERSVSFFEEIRKAEECQHYLLWPLLMNALEAKTARFYEIVHNYSGELLHKGVSV